MKKFFLTSFFGILVTFTYQFLNAQTQSIIIDTTITADCEFYPFSSSDPVYGLSLTGSVNAYSTLYNIPVEFDLNTEQEIENDLYEDLLDLKWQIMNDTLQPDSTTIAALFDIEEHYNTVPGVLARNILIGLGELDYEEPVFVPDFNKSATAGLTSWPENNEAKDNLMKLFPNPAGAYFTVEYNLDGYLGKCTLEVLNINGVGMKSIKLQQEQDQVVIVTSDYSSGIYVVQMVINGEIIEAQKLVLIK